MTWTKDEEQKYRTTDAIRNLRDAHIRLRTTQGGILVARGSAYKAHGKSEEWIALDHALLAVEQASFKVQHAVNEVERAENLRAIRPHEPVEGM